MKIKYIALCLLLALVGCQRDEEMEVAKIDVSNEVIEPRYSSVYISSTITCNAPIEEVSVCLSATHDFDQSKSRCYTMTLQDDGRYSVSIPYLSHSTTYYVHYVLHNMWSSIETTNITTFRTTDTTTIALITTSSPTEVSYASATIGGYVTDDGGLEVTERGVVFSIYQNPTVDDTKVTSGRGLGEFTCNLKDLQDGTIYHVRAYAINEKGIAYGEEVSFTTKERYYENGYEYIDLGLSVKWATCNVGASSPEDYGDYFAWGETNTKSTYNWSTYKWCNGSSSTLTKYNTSSSYGTVDNKTTLELSDDAARANWGGSWRMPTDAEMTELREQCTWTWTTQNGVNGYKVTSKKSGYTNNSIFLPAAGCRSVSLLNDAGSFGCYWSSSLDTGDPNLAWYVLFDSGFVDRYHDSRYLGKSVRPVRP